MSLHNISDGSVLGDTKVNASAGRAANQEPDASRARQRSHPDPATRAFRQQLAARLDARREHDAIDGVHGNLRLGPVTPVDEDGPAADPHPAAVLVDVERVQDPHASTSCSTYAARREPRGSEVRLGRQWSMSWH